MNILFNIMLPNKKNSFFKALRVVIIVISGIKIDTG